MTQPDYSSFKVGAVAQPLVSPGSNTLLQDADPAIFFALDYFSWVITQYDGARLIAAAAACGLGTGQNAITSAVAKQFPRNPKPEWLQTQLQLPLLCIARQTTQTGRKTAGWQHDRGLFELLYVLPPLSAAQEEAIGPILHAIEQALRRKVTDGWDPAYTPPGGSQGAAIWSAAYAGVEAIGFGDPYRDVVEDAHYGALEGTGNLFFPTLRMRGYIIERDMPVPAANKFAGGDMTLGVQADDGTQIPSVVGVATQQPPTITSLSVASGTQAGGTSVTITGTLFLSGPPLVRFGREYAPSVTFNSDTSLTVTTPAMSGGGVVDVVVHNRDGQRAVLSDGFTFTTP